MEKSKQILFAIFTSEFSIPYFCTIFFCPYLVEMMPNKDSRGREEIFFLTMCEQVTLRCRSSSPRAEWTSEMFGEQTAQARVKEVRKAIMNTTERKLVSCRRLCSGMRTLLLLILARSISLKKLKCFSNISTSHWVLHYAGSAVCRSLSSKMRFLDYLLRIRLLKV